MDAGWLSFKSIKVDSTPCLVFYFAYLIFPYINKYHFSNGYYDRSKEQRMHLISEVNHPCIPRFPDPWHVGRKPMNYYHRNVKTLQFVSAQSVADLRAFLSFLKRKKKHFATILRGGGREGVPQLSVGLIGESNPLLPPSPLTADNPPLWHSR